MSERSSARLKARMRIGGRAFLARVRSIFLGAGDDVDGAAAARAVREAELARAAGQLKGGVAKAAQLLGYLVPEAGATRAGEPAAPLATLFSAVPAVPADAVRAVIVEDLGRPPSELFAEFSPEPFAAASLGQVHAARAHGGEELAVKVQYPGVAAALRDDLASGNLVTELAGALGASLEPSAAAALSEAVLAEVDYQQEGRAMARFREAFARDPEVVVPRWFETLSSPRVLSMERIHGRSLDDLRGEPLDVRSAVARVLFRFAWAGPLRTGLLHADPNPGNYLVVSTAPVRVAFLDYGCVRTLAPEVVDLELRLWKSLITRDQWNLGGEPFRQALRDMDLVRGLRTFDKSSYRDWEKQVALPLKTDAAGRGAPFTWDRTYAARLADLTRELVRTGLLSLPAGMLLLWRQRLGAAAVIGALAPRLDFRQTLFDALQG